MIRSLFLLAFMATMMVSTESKHAPACIGKYKKPVDWWVVYYFPGTFRDQNYKVGYQYADSNSFDGDFEIGWNTGDGKGGPINRTVEQINKYKLDTVMWNDNRPRAEYNHDAAHSKFFMAVNEERTNGFAVAHSIPNYPYVFDDGTYNASIYKGQKYNGQHAFCFTLDSQEEIQELLSNANFIQPNLGRNDIEGIETKDQKDAEDFRRGRITVGKSKLHIFRQNGWSSHRQKNIFKHIAVELNSHIFTHTWGTVDKPPFMNECEIKSEKTGRVLSVNNAGDLLFQKSKPFPGVQPSWNERNDHSKWIVTTSEKHICFGDLNRNTESQQQRGGAYYCLEHSGLAKKFTSLLVRTSGWMTCPTIQEKKKVGRPLPKPVTVDNIKAEVSSVKVRAKPPSSSPHQAPACLDPQGQAVDWWFVYQLPRSDQDPWYYYYDSTFQSREDFDTIHETVDAEGQPLRRTIHQLNRPPIKTLVWNGQLESEDSVPKDDQELGQAELEVSDDDIDTDTKAEKRGGGDYAHSKLFMSMNADLSSGFAVDHSFPQFPKFDSENDLIDQLVGVKQEKKAQHAFCFSLKHKEDVKRLVDNVCTINPNIYYDTMPVSLDTDQEKAQYKRLFRRGSCSEDQEVCYFSRCHVEDITKAAFVSQKYKVGEQQMIVHYKNGHMEEKYSDLYEYVLRQLKRNIVYKGWHKPFDSESFDVEGQQLSLINAGRIRRQECNDDDSKSCNSCIGKGIQCNKPKGCEYIKSWCASTCDHSKWLVTAESQPEPTVCFGDLNRDHEAQFRRGGAFYCLSHKGLHSAMHGLLSDFKCSSKPKKEKLEEKLAQARIELGWGKSLSS